MLSHTQFFICKWLVFILESLPFLAGFQITIYTLNTLYKKPGAIRNSIALKSIPRLKALFDTYYSKKPKKFIELFLENKELPIEEIIALFEHETANKGEIDALDVVKPISQIDVSARAHIYNYAALTIGGVQH
jgi:hypothetical protein